MEQWQTVCQQSDLIQDTGICALLNQEQVAIFFCRQSRQLYALSNYDPIGQANVMSRGIIGSLGDQKVVASPLYKQHFSLQSGECLEEPGYRLKTYDVRLSQGNVQLRVN